MKKKLRRKPFEKGLRAGDTRANIREGENTKQKTPHKNMFLPAGESLTETKPENSSC